MKLADIDFASYDSYHTIPISIIDFSEAEHELTDERKKYLRTAAKETTGQASGAGALSAASRIIYSKMVKQAAVKQLWREKHVKDAVKDNDPLTDVEYEEIGSQAGTSFEQSAGKKRKHERRQYGQQEEEEYKLTDVMQSFELSDGQLQFSCEELYKATSMSKTKIKLTDWMLIMRKLAEMQMESTLTAADEVQQLKQQVETLQQKNKTLTETIGQQKTLIKGIHGLLQQRSADAE